MHLKFNSSTPSDSGRWITKIIMVMKMTTALLLIGLLHVSGKAMPQAITLSLKKAPLKKVFKEIRKQSGLLFLYDEALLLNTKNVDIQVQGAPLKDALEISLKDSGLEFEIVERNIVLRKKTFFKPLNFIADTTIVPQVTGKVLDEKGEPLIGATVMIKDTKLGTVADASGVFQLKKVPKDAVLQVRFTGYLSQDVSLAGRDALQIQMKIDDSKLDEVIVVGYGTQKKVNQTGAIAQVDGKELENRPITRVSQALQGMVGNLNITTTAAGGAPNATQAINIRGYTGFNNPSGPLIVIDGVQGGDINTLNPDDIENISVIKDAASAAIYGSSAPFGVILITTKQGSKGKKPAITYKNNLQWATPVNLPKMMNSLDFANIYNEAAINGGRGALISDETIQRIKDYQSGKLKDETIQNKDGAGNPIDSWQEWGGANANNDWFKIYFKDVAFSQQHNLGISGGSNNSNYYVGLGYNDRKGMYNFGNDAYKRYNIRANLNTDISSWLSFGLRSTVSRELWNTPNTYSSNTGGNYLHLIARKWPTLQLKNPDGNYSDGSQVLLHLLGGRNKQVTDNAIITGEFNFKLAKGWTATANYTFNGTFWKQDFHTKTVYATRPSGTQYPMGGTTPNGYYRGSDRTQYQVVNAYTKYEKQLGDHYFSVLGGYTRELREYETYFASNNQLYSDDIPSLNTSFGPTPSVGDGIRRLAVEGYFGRINYNFQNKYLLELNGRYDATSRFLKDYRWKFYPGISAGWNLDKEAFFEPLRKAVNALKLRGSYGSQGDQSFLDASAPNWYPFYPSLGTTRPTSTGWLFGGAQQAAVTPPGLVNPLLTWVTTTQLNIGADAAFLDNRLKASFDWYIRKADDYAYTGTALPAVLGTGVPIENNAGVETRGFEVMLSWSDKIGEVNYNLRGVLSDYRGKVTAFANNPQGDNGNFYVGRSLGEIWGYQTVGLFQSTEEVSKSPSQSKLNGKTWTPGDVRYADLDGNGTIDWGNNTLSNPGDRRVIGNNTPRYAFSFTGDASWNNFDIYIFLQGIAKRDAWVGSNYFWGVNGDEWQSSLFTEHYDRWTPTNPNGYFPKYYLTSEMGKNMNTQTKYLQNAAYLRIKNVQLGYSLPKSLLDPIKFNKVRFYVSVENLATFTNLIKTMDPELSIGDAKIYPLQRTYSAGVNVSF